jgi:hypothetical protein
MVIYRINGVDLQSVAQRIEVGQDLMTAAALTGDGITLPGRDGEINPYISGQQRRADEPARWGPHLWIKGVDPVTGLIGGDGSEQDYYDNVDAAIKMFTQRELAIEAERPDGSIRVATGHLSPGESLDFTRERSAPSFGQYLPIVRIPSGRWVGDTAITIGPLSLATGASVSFAAFAAATAVCTDLVITIGPCSNPKLELNGVYVKFGNTIASGKSLEIDTQFSLIGEGPGTAWTPLYQDLDYNPGPRFFEIDPTGDLSGIFTHTGGGNASLTITGYPHFRTS